MALRHTDMKNHPMNLNNSGSQQKKTTSNLKIKKQVEIKTKSKN